jgi:hypothetical protein
MKSFHHKLKTTQLGTKYIYLKNLSLFHHKLTNLGTKHIYLKKKFKVFFHHKLTNPTGN